MPFTLPPTPPSLSDPSTFASRASAFVEWQANDLVPELNAALATFGPGAPYCTATGTNAQVLTSGLNLSGPVVGQRVWFKAAGTNTGAATLKLDGTAAIACRTITGVALPAGYIRTDVVTHAWYDGTYWVLDRLPEIGSNANGGYERLADGKMTCWGTAVSSSSGSATWTLPAAYPSSSSYRVAVAAVFTTGLPPAVRIDTKTASQMSFDAWRTDTTVRIATNVDFTTIGTWY